MTKWVDSSYLSHCSFSLLPYSLPFMSYQERKGERLMRTELTLGKPTEHIKHLQIRTAPLLENGACRVKTTSYYN